MAQRYVLTSEGYDSVRRTMMQTWVVLVALLATIAIFALHISADDLSSSSRMVVLAAVFAVLGVILVAGLRAGLRAWRGFELLLSADHVERRLPGQPTVELARQDVKVISETADKGLVLQGGSGQPTVFIPTGIDGYAAVRETVANWHPIESRQPRAPWVPIAVAGAVTAALLFAPYLSDSPLTVVPSAILLSLLMGWAAFVIKTNPNVTPQLRRLWWFPMLPAVVAMARALSVLFT